ncbi:hypothetical protein [Microbacterium xylanilyticum]
MTVTWLTILPGLLFGIALGMIVLAYAPQTVRTSDALARLGEASVSTAGPAMKLTRWDRVGSWLAQHLPAIKFLAPPTKDLDLLEMSVSYFYASKAKAALFGFAAPLVLPIFWQLVTGQPSAMLLAPSPIFAIVLWFSVDTNVKARAAKARQEVTRFMGVYLQTVAVALLGNTTPDTALSETANLSDSWVFKRLRREYAAADLTRISKWDALENLGKQLDVPPLVELGRTMRMSEAHVSLREQLLASADQLRDEVAAATRKDAERVTRRATVPVYLTLAVLIVLTLLPSIANLFLHQ